MSSALTQVVAGLTVLVVDNCSDDGTWEALQAFLPKGVVLHRNPRNLGLFANFNRCLDLARSPYLRFLSADDVLLPGCLAAELDLMRRHPQVVMVSSRGRFISPDGRRLGNFADDFPPGVYAGERVARAWFEYYARYRRNPLNYPSGVLFRRSAIATLRFQNDWRSAGDIDFYFRTLSNGDLAISDTPGCAVTRHPGQAHVRPNLDGTTIQEQLSLLERHVPPTARRPLLKYLAGGWTALALRRALRRTTRDSGRLHWRLARQFASTPAALFGAVSILNYRALRVLLRYRAPYVPRPDRGLA